MLIPSHTQKVQINRTIGCVRFAYNPFLALRKEIYVTEQKTLNYNGCSQRVIQLKKEIKWLREVDKLARSISSSSITRILVIY